MQKKVFIYKKKYEKRQTKNVKKPKNKLHTKRATIAKNANPMNAKEAKNARYAKQMFQDSTPPPSCQNAFGNSLLKLQLRHESLNPKISENWNCSI